jgi:ATP-dependent DNA ligase
MVSEGIEGAGLVFFEQVCEQGLEGMVAKRLDSSYLPGKRTEAWTKCKRVNQAHCLILGYLPKGDDDFKSLVIASDLDGELRAIGQVGSGIDDGLRERLMGLLRQRPAAAPLVPCAERARWIEPWLYCTVSYLERQPTGMLRAPVFIALHPVG